MTTTKDNNGKPLGSIEALVSNEHVVNINQTPQVLIVTVRNRATGEVKTEVLYGALSIARTTG